MTDAPLTGLALGFDLAARDLAVIAARLDVVFIEGWWPASPDHNRPSPPLVGPDDAIPGGRFDCGQANYRARQAWQAMAGHLYRADLVTRAVLTELAGVAAAQVSPGRPAAFEVIQSSVTLLGARLAGLERLWSGLERGERKTWMAEALMGRPGREHGSPCWDIEQARHRVVAICAIVGSGRKPPVCGSCHKAGSVGDPRRKGWCTACYRQWFRADKGRRKILSPSP